MFDRSDELPVALFGKMSVGEPNTAIELYKGRLKIGRTNDHFLEEIGSVQLSWFPSPRLRFSIQSQSSLDVDFSIFDDKFSVELLEANMLLEAFGTSLDGHSFTGTITGIAESYTGKEIQHVTFYVPNFADFIGEPIRDSGTRNARAPRTSFAFKNWQIVIEGLPHAKTIYEVLNRQGGYAVTHIGRMWKKSEEPITVEEVKQMRGKLNRYLSFCQGTFCGPLLFTGYDNSETVVWTNWNIPRIQTWRGQGTWFPVHSTGQTKQVLSEYLSITQDSRWNEALHNAIHWFVEAQNASIVDMGIVHAQIGIELLAWAKFVEIDQAVSRDGFNKLTATDRIQLLLSWAGIPIDIPEELENLTDVVRARQKIKGASKWETGPAAIIELRNSIAHPNLRDRAADVTGRARYEVQQLSIWYLELLILKFLNYQGEYNNRWKHKWVGEMEPLPWAVNM